MADTIQIHFTQLSQTNTVTLGTPPDGRTHYGATTPAPGLGRINDTYIQTNRGWVYQKTALAVWTFRGAMATQVSNAYAQFVCPDGQTRRVSLMNLP